MLIFLSLLSSLGLAIQLTTTSEWDIDQAHIAHELCLATYCDKEKVSDYNFDKNRYTKGFKLM